MGEIDAVALARRLEVAMQTRVPVEPLSRAAGIATIDDAYRVQAAWTALRLERGDRLLGRKVGLTSKAMQEAAGVYEPDFGALWASRYFPSEHGRAVIPHDTFIQPRLEGELAVRLARPLAGPGVTAEDVFAALDAVAVSVEVVDSRIVRERFIVLDTIADNASYGAFTLGPWDASLARADLAALSMRVRRDGEEVARGLGADSLGHPANAVAWLANALGAQGVALDAGDIVLSGSLVRAVPVARGDVFVLEVDGQPPLEVVFP